MSRNTTTSAIVDGILRAMTITGMLGMLIIAPNGVQLAEPILKKLDKRARERQTRHAVAYMNHKDLIRYRNLSDGRLELVITDRGRRRAQKLLYDDLRIKTLEKWDRKWRVILFDIPEQQRKARRLFSAKLKQLGLYQLQKSVWISAYPCGLEISSALEFLGIQPQCVDLIETDHLGQNQTVRKHFRL